MLHNSAMLNPSPPRHLFPLAASVRKCKFACYMWEGNDQSYTQVRCVSRGGEGMAPSFSGAGVARAAKRGHGAALELPAGPRPLLAAAAAAAAAPRESNPLCWGPPPLEPVPDAGPRDSVFAAAASEDEPMAEADAPVLRSTLSLMPRCLAVARPNNRASKP